MLTRIDFMPTQFLKKSPYTGSHSGMRYRMEQEDDHIKTTIWPGPFAFAKAEQDKMESFNSSFDEDGIEAAIAWLNEKYEERKDEWDHVPILGRG